MRKIGLVAIFSACMTVSGLAGFSPDNLELRLSLGPAYWCGGDFNKGIRGENDYIKDFTLDSDGIFKPLGLGYSLTVGGVYWVNPNMGVGLDIGYTRAAVGEHEVWMEYEFYRQTSTLSYNASALAVKPSFHYGFPLCGNSFFEAFFGPSYYCGSIHFNKEYAIDPHDYGSTYEFKGKASSLGLHGGVGVDYKLNDNLRFFGSLNFDVTSLKNLKDDWAIEWRNSYESGSENGTGDTLWVFDYQPNGTKYTLWDFRAENDPPQENAVVSNVRKGSIGGPAVGVTLGIKYTF